MATNTQQGTYKPRPTINNATTKDPGEREVFAMMTMDDVDFEVTTSPPLSDPRPPNEPPTNSYNTMGQLGHRLGGVQAGSGSRSTFMATCNSDTKILPNVSTLIDSGASDHCFVNKNSFLSLTPLHQPTIGLATGKESTFNVAGKGKVRIETTINSTSKIITFEDALHTPELCSNLILVSKLAEKGIRVEFDEHGAQLKTASSTIVMTAKRCSRLYAVETRPETPTALVMETKRQAVTFDTWH